MITLSPVGFATTTSVANQLSVLATIREKLCKQYCVASSVQPQTNVIYTTGTPYLNGTTVFVPVSAVLTVVTQGCGCKASTQLFTERFVVAFQGQTALPTSVTVSSSGRAQYPYMVSCGKASQIEIDDSLVIAIS